MSAPVAVFAYPDREKMVRQLLLDELTEVVPGLRVVTQLPPEFETPLIWVKRGGGGADDGVTDIAIMQVHYYGPTRDFAIGLATLGETLILSAGGRAIDIPGYGRPLIDWTDLVVGSTDNPDLDPDDRRFSVDYAVAARRSALTINLGD